jgi:tol-pal system protein YbgF
MLGRPDRQGKMSSRFHQLTGVAAVAACLSLSSLALSSQARAQSDDGDPEIRIQQLENQLRQLTGQNEELQYRNRQLEDRLRQLQGGAQPGPGAPPAAQPNVAAAPPMQISPNYNQPPQAQGGYGGGSDQQPRGYGQQRGGYGQSQAGYGQQQPGGYGQPPAPIAQEPSSGAQGRRGDAFDPTQSPNAPGAPRALGGGQLPMSNSPGGRGDYANANPSPGASPSPGVNPSLGVNPSPGASPGPGGARYPQGGAQPPVPSGDQGGNGQLATAPPTNSPRDEYDLGIGYMQRKDYALAEQTMRNFAQKYPNDAMLGDSQYWLGESLFQRQQYREAAEIFLNVTSKYDKSAKAPDSLLRLGQSLAALKEKEAACAAFGEVTRKYPRASTGVKSAVDREQKRVKC